MLIFFVSLFFYSCNPVEEYTEMPGGIKVKEDTTSLYIRFVNPSVVRITYSPLEPEEFHQKYIIDGQLSYDENIEVSAEGEKIEISSPEMTVTYNQTSQALTFFDAEGNEIIKEYQRNPRELNHFSYKDDNGYSLTQRFVLTDEESIYGFGQHQEGILNYRGKEVELYQDNMKASLPVMISTNGYGILWDNYSYSTFSDDSLATFRSEIGDGIDYYLMYGPEMDDVIKNYRSITGKAPMFPLWAYGFFQSKARYVDQQEVINTVKEYRKRNVPLDVIVQDWMYWPGPWGAKQFDRGRYPDPGGMMKTLHDELNTHLIISVWPCFTEGSQDYQQMEDKGFLYEGIVTGEETNVSEKPKRFYDVYNPDARDLFWKQANDSIFSFGIDGWWADCTEPMVNSWQTTLDEMRSIINPPSGSGARYLNSYSLLQSEGMYRGQRNTTTEKRVFNLTRSGFPGQQRYAAVTWSGDISANWNDFKNQIPAGLNFSVAGIPYWTCDIGAFFVNDKDWFRTGIFPEGINDPAYHEFFTRWYQYGAFLPIFRVHGAQTPREIWHFGEPGDVAYDTQVKFNQLRYRLMPYIYSVAAMVTFDDYTMLRPLVMDFGSDKNVVDISDQYMFGPSFMVCPVTEPGALTREVYLPVHDGGWYDFWSGKHYKGGQTISAEAPLSSMPLFVKAGSIIPMGPFIQHTGDYSIENLELRLYPGADGAFVFYEDEHDNYNYEDGSYARVVMRWDGKNQLVLDEAKGVSSILPGKMNLELFSVNEENGIGLEKTGIPEKILEYKSKEINTSLL